MVVHVLGGIVTTSLVFPMVAPTRRQALVQRWSRRLLHLLRVEARLHGAIDVHGGNVLLVANHISWLDIFVLNAHRPARFVAKSELAGWPLAGRLIRGAGTIFVDRERRHDTRRVNHHAAQALAAGDVVAVFPEGTTTDGATLLKFHASLLQPIVEAQGHVRAGGDPLPRRGWRALDRAGVRRRRVVRDSRSGASAARAAWWSSSHAAPALAARRRAPARSRARGRGGYPNGFGVIGCRDGTWKIRRSGSLTPVSVPPQRQPESSISTLGASSRSSVDQCPQTTSACALRR